jgi:hypothetical protein
VLVLLEVLMPARRLTWLSADTRAEAELAMSLTTTSIADRAGNTPGRGSKGLKFEVQEILQALLIDEFMEEIGM